MYGEDSVIMDSLVDITPVEGWDGAKVLQNIDMLPNISDMRYKDILFNHKTETVFAHVKQGRDVVLWIISK